LNFASLVAPRAVLSTNANKSDKSSEIHGQSSRGAASLGGDEDLDRDDSKEDDNDANLTKLPLGRRGETVQQIARPRSPASQQANTSTKNLISSLKKRPNRITSGEAGRTGQSFGLKQQKQEDVSSDEEDDDEEEDEYHERRKHSAPQVRFSNSTLFLTACANGDLDECKRLLENKLVDIDTTTCDSLTGLHEAAIVGNEQLAEYLIENGANINCRDNEGWTPLHAAASLGQTGVVQLLLNYGADATMINCENFLAYDLARNDECRHLIGQALEGQDIEYLRNQEERLIENDINNWLKTGVYQERSQPTTNATVLHVLAAKGYVNLMKKILEHPSLKKQINLEAKDNEGYTPLLAASFWNQSQIVELLIEHGANIFAQANDGYKISSIVSIDILHNPMPYHSNHTQSLDLLLARPD